MPNVLVVGAGGLLGQYLVREAVRRGLDVVATHREPMPSGLRLETKALDLRDRAAIARTVREAEADVVVNAAALTDVDGCEGRPEEAESVNALAPAALAEAAKKSGAAFVHASTDYVFDGTGPATEETDPRPLNAYGASKLRGERLALRADPDGIVIRLSAVYGWNRLSGKTNSVTWILKKLEAGLEVPCFQDQRITPTYAPVAAAAALDLWRAAASGVFHVASSDCLTRVEMGHAVAETFGIPGARITPIAMASIALRAPRPKEPCLVVRKVEETLKRSMPPFRASLEDMRATR